MWWDRRIDGQLREELDKARMAELEGKVQRIEEVERLQKIFRHLPPDEGGAQLVDRFLVDEDHPLLVGVILALRSMQETAAENAAVVEQAPDVTKYYVGGMDALKEAEAIIAQLVVDAAVRGKGTKAKKEEK